jgi:hypothetical protein
MIGAIVVGDANGDAGLDPAAVVATDTSGTGGEAATPVDTGSGTGWSTVALAAVCALAIGLLGFAVLRRSRDRRVPTSV